MLGGELHGAERVQLFAGLGGTEGRLRALLRASLPEGRVLLLAERVRVQIGLRGGGRRVQTDLPARVRERGMRGAPRVQVQGRVPAGAGDGGNER